MTYLAKAAELIKEFEGLRLTSYRCPAGVLTVGYGHTGPDVRENLEITLDDADSFLFDDMLEADAAIEDHVDVPLTENQRAALVSWVFNLGRGALRGSTMLKLLNDGDYDGASKQLLRWNKAGGAVLAGLTRRREAEKKLFDAA